MKTNFTAVPMKGILLFFAKVVVTAISIYIISQAVSWDGLIQLFANIRLEWFVLAILIFWGAQIISSLRCVYVVRVLGKELDLLTSVRAHFIGLWFNQVLPTSLGGDLVKVSILKNHVGLSVGARATVIDRASGLMVLMCVLFLQLPLYTIHFDSGSWVVAIGLISSISILSVVVFSCFASSVNNKFNYYFGVKQLVNLMADIWEFRKGRALWGQLWTSLVVHTNGVISYGLIGKALGLNVDFVLFFLAVPLVFLIALLPFSFAGWGVREVGSIWVFSTIGVSSENALGMSVGFGILLLVAGLPGLAVWLLRK